MAPEKRDELLSERWRSSDDIAWATSGDAFGFHVLVAEARTGYSWRTAATLSEPGVAADQWIGNACLASSGKRLAVAYAPRTFTNDAALSGRGAFTAVVDLIDGSVVKLPMRSSTAHFNPGCGADDRAVFTQEGHEDKGLTRLVEVDVARGAVADAIVTAGQVTSAVPTSRGVLAANGSRVVSVSPSGNQEVQADVAGTPFELHPDADGGLVFLERSGDRVTVQRLHDDDIRGLATGKLSHLRVSSGARGQVFITGEGGAAGDLPRSVRKLDVPARARPSTSGELVLTDVGPRKDAEGRPAAPFPAESAEPVEIAAEVLATGARLDFGVVPESDRGPDGNEPSPGLDLTEVDSGLQSAADPTDPDRSCAVVRNDPRTQVYQPTKRQVEWAANQAVQHNLFPPRPANWKQSGLPAWTPQAMFPPVPLEGGGEVPAQIMLGVLTQESNMAQASWHALPGVTGNPLIGNYYGTEVYDENPGNDWDVDFAEADCGYGMAQVTDHMRRAGHERPGDLPAWPADKQRAVALDYATNLAAGLQILQQKWNATHSAGMVVNNGDPSKIENWFYALWAYNSGFYPQGSDPSGQWGVGWFNNPVNPRYPADRNPFLEFTYHDASHPQDWPYPEKVIGWAGHPLADADGAGYRAAWWNDGPAPGAENRETAKPPVELFCDARNSCDPAAAEACLRADFKCWFHWPATWKADCGYSCGNEFIRFDTTYPEQPDGNKYPPACDLDGLPPNALIVDDVPDSVPPVRTTDRHGNKCVRPHTNSGTFDLNFATDAQGRHPSKVDFHQIGGGFGGHFWFAHTRQPGAWGGKMDVTGTWTLDRPHTGPMKIMVALPDHGAHTNLADYRVNARPGERSRVTKQPGEGNRWVSIGAYMFDNVVPRVTLSSVTPDGTGDEDIAFDAVAFIPIQGEYREESIEAVAVFDEDQNIDTSAPGAWLAGPLAGRQALHDWAIERSNAILAQPGAPSNVARAVRAWQDEVRLSGVDPVNHPDGHSIARWIHFANSYLDRPSSDQRPAGFDDDARYKIRTKATVSFVVDGGKQVIPGSESVVYSHRTADTHLPPFVLDLIRAINSDYEVPEPDLTYRMQNLNEHNSAWTTANPMRDAILPGGVYGSGGTAPQLVDAAGKPTAGAAACVRATTSAGGTIGYRPMLAEAGPADAMLQYSNRIRGDARIAPGIGVLVEDIRKMFFARDGLNGVETSLFAVAPPIWQELRFDACADGTVRKVDPHSPILRASLMPDQYLYHNNTAISRDGVRTGSNGPVLKGDFFRFSNLPETSSETPWGQCQPIGPDRFGNPWTINPDLVLKPKDYEFRRFCSDGTLDPDPAHSW
ncbi:golvesin C-terminal-like domain-containing protein [Saccharopolyspora sp. NPDC003752]